MTAATATVPAVSCRNVIKEFGDGDSRVLALRGITYRALGAADAKTGKRLWSFAFPESLHTSPMTYMFDNKQYVAMISGSVVYAFGLPE